MPNEWVNRWHTFLCNRHSGPSTRNVAYVKLVLIDEAWGKETAITERVVDNQIANLRKKIEPSAAEPRYLKSVRGIGYRFDPEEMT